MANRILVTGGGGYIGSRLVPVLLEKGYEVRVLDKLIFGKDVIEPFMDDVELVVKDIRGVDASVMKGVSAVIHLAGLSNDPTAEYNPEANSSINTEGTLHVAKLAKQSGVGRFIFASSCSVYYTLSPDDRLRTEDMPVEPEAPYSYSKYQAELGLKELIDPSFDVFVLRKGTIFGQAHRMRYDLVVNTFTKDAFTKRRLNIHAGGRMWRPMCHIDDSVDAYVACLEAEPLDQPVINLLSGNYRVIQIAHEVRRALEAGRGIKLDLEVQEVGAVRSYRVDGSYCEEAIGFKPCRNIRSAVEEMWDAIELGVDVDHPRFYNIVWLEMLCDMQRRLEVMGGKVL